MPIVRAVTDDTLNGQIGLITDCLEGADGFYDFEVTFEGGRGWFSDLELTLLTRHV